MEKTERRIGGGFRSQPPAPTRLQRRAPASLQISQPNGWNVAIPLLTPLVSPSSSEKMDLPGPAREEARYRDKTPTFKKWQHPASPFYYGPVAMAAPFVPV